jgi:hypothetical protein
LPYKEKSKKRKEKKSTVEITQWKNQAESECDER